MEELASDAAFLQGLDNILAPLRERGATEAELEETTQRAAAFYLRQRAAQTHGVVTNGADPPAGATQTSQDAAPGEETAPERPPYPSSFSAIAELISSGAPLDPSTVPGMKHIPERLNPEPPSEPRLAGIEGAGRKPWERSGEA